ncbi:MAG TPA: glycosyltransferase [Nitrospiria bacterium]|nr:glycosyltransferase [Nitrospiria bacterium]
MGIFRDERFPSMRLLFVITNLSGGGAEKSTVKLLEGLAGRGHEVHLLLLENKIVYTVPSGVRVHVLLPAGRRLSSGWVAKRVMALRLRAWYRHMTATAHFDLSISALPYADEMVRLAHLGNCCHQIHHMLSGEIRQLSLKSPRKAARRLNRYRKLYSGRRLIAVSEGIARDLSDTVGVTNSSIVIIHNPFDFNEIRQLSLFLEPDLPKEPYIIHVGRFSMQKRHDLLLTAFAESHIPHLLVLLTDPVPQLVEMIESRGLTSRVIIAGFRNNPYPWYARALALVLSSDYEGMPNVLVEALACGVPVVSTACGSGASEILAGPMRHFLVPCGDVARLAQAIRDVVQSPPIIDPGLLSAFSSEDVIGKIESLAIGE